jgi:hypothetical protein
MSNSQSVSPTVKGTTSQAECSIRLLKRALTKLCLYRPEDWSNNLVLAVNFLNNSILYNQTTINQLFFSPTHYANRLNLIHLADFPELIFDQQYKDLKSILASRDKQFQKSANVKYDIIQPGMLVADHYLPGKTASTTSR